MLFRDVVERHRIKNISLLEKVLQKLLLSFTKEASIHRWYNDFRSQGIKASKDTLYEYISYFEQALFVHTVVNSAAEGGAKKIYLVDNGLYQKVKDKPDLGKLWENQVYIDLIRRGKKPVFWKRPQGEIDFITDEDMIQATVELTDQNRGREEGAFDLAQQYFPRHGRKIIQLD
jgi:predicted AAA+ superfamily ATPase